MPAPFVIPRPVPPEASFAWWPGMIWLLVGGALAARRGLARLLVVLLGRRRRKTDDAALLARVQDLACRLGIRRRLQVVEARGLAGPVTFGIFCPTICLPEGFTRHFSTAQQQAMLAHELAHLMARDPAWYALADAVAALLWWHPLVWWARRQLHAASEAAADEGSLLIENGPEVLAECLVTLGRQLV